MVALWECQQSLFFPGEEGWYSPRSLPPAGSRSCVDARHSCLSPALAIDLLNVSFGASEEDCERAPDRLSGRSTLEELQLGFDTHLHVVLVVAKFLPSFQSLERAHALVGVAFVCRACFPDRVWRFVAINVTHEEVLLHSEHISAVLHPLDTVMDFNIGAALWFAGRGQGTLSDGTPYCSRARVVLSGAGADEQLGGYARHVTAACKDSDSAGWHLLREELHRDLRRLWIRNLGTTSVYVNVPM